MSDARTTRWHLLGATNLRRHPRRDGPDGRDALEVVEVNHHDESFYDYALSERDLARSMILFELNGGWQDR